MGTGKIHIFYDYRKRKKKKNQLFAVIITKLALRNFVLNGGQDGVQKCIEAVRADVNAAEKARKEDPEVIIA